MTGVLWLQSLGLWPVFRAWDVDQGWRLPPSVHEFVPPGHLAHFVRDKVREALDLSAIRDAYAEERGFPPYPHQLGPAESAAVFSADLGDVLCGAPVLPQQDAGCPLVDPGTIALKADAIAAKRMRKSAISRIT